MYALRRRTTYMNEYGYMGMHDIETQYHFTEGTPIPQCHTNCNDQWTDTHITILLRLFLSLKSDQGNSKWRRGSKDYLRKTMLDIGFSINLSIQQIVKCCASILKHNNFNSLNVNCTDNFNIISKYSEVYNHFFRFRYIQF